MARTKHRTSRGKATRGKATRGKGTRGKGTRGKATRKRRTKRRPNRKQTVRQRHRNNRRKTLRGGVSLRQYVSPKHYREKWKARKGRQGGEKKEYEELQQKFQNENYKGAEEAALYKTDTPEGEKYDNAGHMEQHLPDFGKFALFKSSRRERNVKKHKETEMFRQNKAKVETKAAELKESQEKDKSPEKVEEDRAEGEARAAEDAVALAAAKTPQEIAQEETRQRMETLKRDIWQIQTNRYDLWTKWEKEDSPGFEDPESRAKGLNTTEQVSLDFDREEAAKNEELAEAGANLDMGEVMSQKLMSDMMSGDSMATYDTVTKLMKENMIDLKQLMGGIDSLVDEKWIHDHSGALAPPRVNAVFLATEDIDITALDWNTDPTVSWANKKWAKVKGEHKCRDALNQKINQDRGIPKGSLILRLDEREEQKDEDPSRQEETVETLVKNGDEWVHDPENPECPSITNATDGARYLLPPFIVIDLDPDRQSNTWLQKMTDNAAFGATAAVSLYFKMYGVQQNILRYDSSVDGYYSKKRRKARGEEGEPIIRRIGECKAKIFDKKMKVKLLKPSDIDSFFGVGQCVDQTKVFNPENDYDEGGGRTWGVKKNPVPVAMADNPIIQKLLFNPKAKKNGGNILFLAILTCGINSARAVDYDSGLITVEFKDLPPLGLNAIEKSSGNGFFVELTDAVPGSQAEELGLKKGWVPEEINGQSLKGMHLDQVINMLRQKQKHVVVFRHGGQVEGISSEDSDEQLKSSKTLWRFREECEKYLIEQKRGMKTLLDPVKKLAEQGIDETTELKDYITKHLEGDTVVTATVTKKNGIRLHMKTVGCKGWPKEIFDLTEKEKKSNTYSCHSRPIINPDISTGRSVMAHRSQKDFSHYKGVDGAAGIFTKIEECDRMIKIGLANLSKMKKENVDMTTERVRDELAKIYEYQNMKIQISIKECIAEGSGNDVMESKDTEVLKALGIITKCNYRSDGAEMDSQDRDRIPHGFQFCGITWDATKEINEKWAQIQKEAAEKERPPGHEAGDTVEGEITVDPKKEDGVDSLNELTEPVFDKKQGTFLTNLYYRQNRASDAGGGATDWAPWIACSPGTFVILEKKHYDTVGNFESIIGMIKRRLIIDTLTQKAKVWAMKKAAKMVLTKVAQIAFPLILASVCPPCAITLQMSKGIGGSAVGLLTSMKLPAGLSGTLIGGGGGRKRNTKRTKRTKTRKKQKRAKTRTKRRKKKQSRRP